LPPDEGTIRRADGLRVVVFDQKREELPQDIPLRRALSADGDTIVFRERPIHVTAWARRFLFRIEQLDLPVRDLSGGEQARVLIARLMLRPADVLVLDEPTNDLDISSLDIIEESLSDFPGAIVLVTHDRFMLDRICTQILGFDGEGQAGWYINCAHWQETLAQRAEQSAAPKPKPKAPPKKTNPGGLTAGEKRELRDMEAAIEEAEQQIETCRLALEELEQTSDYVETQKRWEALEAAKKQVESLYARWQELEAKTK
jgi:ATP-binding cassette subfamily F protein uup